jgi:hypothetical protein
MPHHHHLSSAWSYHTHKIIEMQNKVPILYALFWVIPRRLNFICRHFRTLLSVPSTYEDGTDSVLKRWHIKFRRRGITQKKAYNIQNTPKVWNQESANVLQGSCLTSRRKVTVHVALLQCVKSSLIFLTMAFGCGHMILDHNI